MRYQDPKTDEIHMLKFNEFYMRLAKSLQGNPFTIKELFFPFLGEHNLTRPYNVNYKNIQKLWRSLRRYLDKCQDEDSVYYQVVNELKVDKKEAFQDLIGLLYAGHETTTHAIASALYFLHKNPEVKEKLQEELKEFSGKTHEELKSLITHEKVEELQYLHFVCKETLRIDPPAMDGIVYEVVEDTTICDVPFKKGQAVQLNILVRHYDPKQWHDPVKFIPERFDPESKYYTIPGSNKPRDPLSWIPFSVHTRKCTGQNFALTEMKVFLLYLLSTVDFTFPQEILDSSTSYFSIISQLKLKFSVSPKESKQNMVKL